MSVICLLLSPLNSYYNWLLVCKKEKDPLIFVRTRVPSVSSKDLSGSVGRGCSRKVQQRLISEAEVKNFLDVVIAVSRTQYRDRGCGCRLLKVLHMPGSSDKLLDVTDQRRVLTDFLSVNYKKTGGTASVNALLVLKLAQRDISVLMLQVSWGDNSISQNCIQPRGSYPENACWKTDYFPLIRVSCVMMWRTASGQVFIFNPPVVPVDIIMLSSSQILLMHLVIKGWGQEKTNL